METDMDMKTTIRMGDADTVRLLLAEDVSHANALGGRNTGSSLTSSAKLRTSELCLFRTG
jgi:hypothetical protein